MSRKATKKRHNATFEVLEGRRLLTTSVWVGTAGDHLFSDAANWQDDTVPASGNDLQFNDLGSAQTVNFDIAVTAGNISASNNYTFTGSTVTLLGDVATGTNSSITFDNAIDIGANSHFTPDTGGAITLNTLNDNSSDTLDKYGSGTLTFDGNSDAQWQLLQGVMNVNANTNIQLSEYGGQGAVLEGSGSVDSLSSYGGTITLTNGSTPSTFTGANNLYIDGGTVNATLTNAAHSTLTGNSGTIDLNDGPTLSVALGSGFAASNGTVYTLISNNTGSATEGTFAGLAQGATVTAGGQEFTISYTGGNSGHDVTLTASSAAPTVTVSSSVTSTLVNQPVTLTAHVSGSSGTPGGTVTFLNGSTVLGTGTLSNGVATLSTSALPAGTDSITASYGGSSVYAGGVSAATSVAVSSTGPVITNTGAIFATAKSIKLTATGLDTSTSLTDSLTYTWSLLKAPSGAKAIKFVPNATTGAATTVAAISKDGTYDFVVTVKDSAGHTATEEVQFYARQIARGLDVTPASAKVKRSGHVTFSTTAIDQFGHALRTNTTSTVYSVVSGSGSVTSAGVYTASSSKTGKSIVKVTLDGETSDATITVS